MRNSDPNLRLETLPGEERAVDKATSLLLALHRERFLGKGATWEVPLMDESLPILVEDMLNQGDELGREFGSRLLLGRIDGRKLSGVEDVLVFSLVGLGFGLGGRGFPWPTRQKQATGLHFGAKGDTLLRHWGRRVGDLSVSLGRRLGLGFG